MKQKIIKSLECKSTITEQNNSLYTFNNRVDVTKERMQELEDKTIQINHSEQQRESRVKEKK